MRVLLAGWRVYLPVIVGNALVQALSVAPFATPAPSALFIVLAAVSFAALVVSLAFAAQAARRSAAVHATHQSETVQATRRPAAVHATQSAVAVQAGGTTEAPQLVDRMPGYRPTRRTWLTATVAVLVIGAVAVVAPPLVLVALTLAVIVLSGRHGVFSGFRAFAGHPVRATVLTIVCLVVTALLWVGALLAGFFITGVASAALTWIVFGFVAVALLSAWATLQPPDESPRPSP